MTPDQDLQKAQARLGRALERARVGEDRELAGEVRERGAQLAQIIHGALRMSRVHSADNQAFDRPVEELGTTLERLIGLLGPVRIVTVEDQVYVNDMRIRFQTRGQDGDDLGAELRRHNVGGLTFHAPLSVDHIRQILAAFSEPPAQDGRRAAVIQRLSAAGVRDVELSGVYRFRKSGEGASVTRRTPRQILEQAVELVQEAWSNVGEGRALNVLPLRRIVAELLDAGIRTDALWREMSGETPHGRHAMRVCRLALLVGDALGLSDGVLQDLGVAALVHDAGYAGGATDLAGHATRGASLMLRQRGFHEAKVRRLLALLSHHRDHDGEGGRPPLFGRILRIAEDFDNLCRPGGGQLNPAIALAAMAADTGTRYDPVLFQALANGLGRYPPGTWLELDDGEAVRVISLAREGLFDQPLVMTRAGARRDLAEGGAVARVLRRPPG